MRSYSIIQIDDTLKQVDVFEKPIQRLDIFVRSQQYFG